MKISASSSGGYAGQSEHFELDTHTHRNGKAIETLLGELDFFGATPPDVIGADLSRWQLSVDDGHRRRTITFAEDGSAASAPWQNLLAGLRAQA